MTRIFPEIDQTQCFVNSHADAQTHQQHARLEWHHWKLLELTGFLHNTAKARAHWDTGLTHTTARVTSKTRQSGQPRKRCLTSHNSAAATDSQIVDLFDTDVAATTLHNDSHKQRGTQQRDADALHLPLKDFSFVSAVPTPITPPTSFSLYSSTKRNHAKSHGCYWKRPISAVCRPISVNL